jgi:K+-transporting ATPase ATPase C chain
MASHIRSCIVLLVATVLICSVLYPLALLAMGKTLFRDKAEGGIVPGPDGQPAGARLIAQAFKGNQYFQPRPSAVDYNASASGASNFGASNPLLRDRVARALGPIVTYRSGPKAGQPVSKDVETWFGEQAPDFVARWASDHSTLAEQWVKDHVDSVAAWLNKDVTAIKADTGDAAKAFFESYAKRHPGTWPGEEEGKDADGKPIKHIAPLQKGADVQAYLFDPWLQANPTADLVHVPADLVMTSGSGLDPHITEDNARFQLDRVVSAWAEKKGLKNDSAKDTLKRVIEKLVGEHTEAPLGGLVGVPLVNVLELNLALEKRLAGRTPVASR